MDNIRDFVFHSVRQSFEIELGPQQAIGEVWIDRAGVGLFQVPANHLEIEGNVFTVTGDSEVRNGDQLIVKVFSL